jgi:DNA-binding NarL/FixJ family response regulator
MGECILIVSSSAYFANNMKERIRHYDLTARVTIVNDPKPILTAPEKIRADILMLETNCWYGATPVFIANILERKKDLTVCVFGYEELPSHAVASFFHYGASAYIDVREGLESVYEAVKKILRGGMYVPDRYRKCVENDDCDYYDSDKLSASEYWLCRLISFGMELEACAELMKITLATARFYKAQVYKKLDVHNTSALVEKCRQLGIVKPDDVFQNILSDDEINTIRKERKNVCKKQNDAYKSA